MTATELKIPISCRVYPDLKSEIEEEAYEEGLTTSMYLEKILQNRHESQEKEEDVDFVNVYQFEVEIDELKVEVESLQDEVVKLRKLNQKLSAKNEVLEEKTKWLHLLDFDEDEVKELERMLEKLQPSYPAKANSQMVLACIHAALKNEESILFIYTPSSYFTELLGKNY